MPSQNTDTSIKLPASLWQRPIVVDLRGVIKAGTKAIKNFLLGKHEDMLADFGEALAAAGLQITPGELAGLLIQRSLQSAIIDFIKDNANWIPNPDFDGDEALDSALEQEHLVLDQQFFERPRDLALLARLQSLLCRWLIGRGMAEDRAETAVERLPAYFVAALHAEWQQHSTDYAPILTAINTPFARADERERAWRRYNAFLQKQIDESLFDETFSLRQVYIPLRAIKRLPYSNHQASRYQVVNLQHELDLWLAQAAGNDVLRVLSGGPGSGKSSFCKVYAAHVSERTDMRVLFIPLHRFDIGNDLESAVGEFVRLENLLADNPLDPARGEKNLLLLFDGLDELAMQGKAGLESAREFIRLVEKNLGNRNQDGRRVWAILSGRTLVVQANEVEFRQPGVVLEFLPYVVPDAERSRMEDPGNLLVEDQRHAWWKSYGRVTGKPLEEMPPELNTEALRPITSEPLLNYLVALSHGRKQINFSQQVNMNVIHQDLLAAVYRRGYDQGRPYPPMRGMDEAGFVRVLEEIALAVWHGNARTTTLSAIVEHCEAANITRLLEIFQVGLESGATRLLTAFYFRQYGTTPTGDKTFEFTHKSFGEYLTAVRLVRGLERVHQELCSHQDNVDSGWNEKQALKHWCSLCGPTPMDDYVFGFLKDQVALKSAEEVREWQASAAGLIGELQKIGMPMQEFPGLTYRQMQQQSRNAEEALLAAHSACAFVTQEVSAIASLLHASNLHNWLNRLQSEWITKDTEFARQCLVYLKLPETNLRGANLRGANLRGADINGADLRGSDLSEADLTGTNLSAARLMEADLTKSDLTDAKLTGANLSRANLSRANLTRGDLTGTDLTRANLTGVNLTGVIVREANFTGANWWDADPCSFAGTAEAVLHQYLALTFPNLQVQIRNGP